ncbi:hypothetical protein LOTGIDRAFT_235791 [Lottia gigantea]|uniref:Uncharacterized protein n=1 Tax=Lottia gigantea TaxID=225164 RepID=V3ZRU7_LOTGI|nr:hypothetical protein LOTGIDRAFT_235791 [Lottia gigantea]ESO85275.1 hypothetical protein LOTGIDRAFT_235791 [Lottia gigantea]
MNWKVLAGVLLVLYVTVATTKEIRNTASNIQHGLSLAKEIGDFVVAKNFTNVIGKLATAVTPYLGIIGPCVSFIMGFVAKTETAELKAIKDLSTKVDNRFDRVDSQFDEVKNLIEWVKVQVQYSSAEQRINALNARFENIYTFSTKDVRKTTSAFVNSYDSTYQESGTILYQGIMQGGHVFGGGLFTSVVKHTNYHRGKSQAFMLGLLKLLMKAAKLELTYYQLTHKDVRGNQNQWSTRFSEVRKKMMATDAAIVKEFKTQSGKDIDDLLKNNLKTAMNNNDFNNMIYGYLTEKYSWKDWLTVTYNDITGGNVHYVGECGGYIKFRNHGRNFVAASVDRSKRHINMATARSIVSKVDSCKVTTSYRPHKHNIYSRKDADKAYQTFPSSVRDHCDPYAAQGVISNNGYDVHIKGLPSRMYWRKQEKCNHVFIFG